MYTKLSLLEEERDYPWQWFTPVIWSQEDLDYRAAHARFEEDNVEGAVRQEAA